jgi:hypothetical protein
VDLDGVQAAVSYDNYPDKILLRPKGTCAGISEVPLLAYLSRNKWSPHAKFQTPAILWSTLRHLMLSPHEEMTYLQPKDESVMLEELRLTHLNVTQSGFQVVIKCPKFDKTFFPQAVPCIRTSCGC